MTLYPSKRTRRLESIISQSFRPFLLSFHFLVAFFFFFFWKGRWIFTFRYTRFEAAARWSGHSSITRHALKSPSHVVILLNKGEISQPPPSDSLPIKVHVSILDKAEYRRKSIETEMKKKQNTYRKEKKNDRKYLIKIQWG